MPSNARRMRMTQKAKEVQRIQTRENTRVFRAEVKRLVHAAKDHPCVDCGVLLPPEVMELDHVRGVKSFDVSGPHTIRCIPDLTRLETLELEIAKCDPRCPTHHKLRHFNVKIEAA